MKFKLFFSVIILSYVIKCSHGSFVNFLNTSNDSFAMYKNIMDELLEDCYKDVGTIFIYDNSSNKNDFLLPMKPSKSRIVFDNYKEIASSKSRTMKMDGFFVVVHAYGELHFMLEKLRDSKYWNNQSPFVIFNKGPEQCKDVWVYLSSKMYSVGVLNAYFVCPYSTHYMVLTYNPFIDYVADLWKRSTRLSRGNCFHRFYTPGKLCQGFHFDRAKYLNGEFVKIMAKPVRREYLAVLQDGEYYDTRTSIPIFGDTNPPMVLSVLQRFLKVNFQFTFTVRERVCNSSKFNTSKLRPDLFFTLHCLSKLYTCIFPPFYDISGLLSHDPGYQTIFEQIYNLYGMWMSFYTVSLLIIVFLVCWYVAKKDRVVFASFEVLRLLVNASISTEMSSTSIRIFFSAIFIYFLIVQAVLQGQLSKFYTHPNPVSPLDALEDLSNKRYTNIFLSLQTQFSVEPRIVNTHLKLHEITSSSDFDTFSRDKSSAILGNIRVMKQALIVYKNIKLHLAREFYHAFPFVFHVHYDSPLRDRLNTAFMIFWESGVSDMLRKYRNNIGWYHFSKIEADLEVTIKPINLKSLEPIFFFLIVGLTLATMCFCVEYIVGRKKNELINQENGIVNRLRKIHMNRKKIFKMLRKTN